MNRSAINGDALGSGTFSSRIQMTIAQAMCLVGTLRNSLIKSGSAATGLVLNGSLRATQRVSVSLSAAASLCGQLSASVWQRVYGASVQFLRLDSSVRPSIKVQVKVVAEAALSGSATSIVLHHVHASATNSLALVGSLTGYDLNTSRAPVDRCASIYGVERFVAVPSADSNTGI